MTDPLVLTKPEIKALILDACTRLSHDPLSAVQLHATIERLKLYAEALAKAK